MTDGLTPAQALAYLRELSPAVIAARIRDETGATIAAWGAPEALAGAVLESGAGAARPPGERTGARGVIHVHAGELELSAAIGTGAMAKLVRGDAAAAVTAVRIQC